MEEITREDQLTRTTMQWLNERGVTVTDIAELVMHLQQKYFPDLTIADCEANVHKVLLKREVQNAVLTGIQLDRLAEAGLLEAPLASMIDSDEGLYGCDEILALSVVNVYGSIGLTNFGYIDKIKPGILEHLNNKTSGQIHTFLDDLVGAIASAASSRLAHTRKS